MTLFPAERHQSPVAWAPFMKWGTNPQGKKLFRLVLKEGTIIKQTSTLITIKQLDFFLFFLTRPQVQQLVYFMVYFCDIRPWNYTFQASSLAKMQMELPRYCQRAVKNSEEREGIEKNQKEFY